MYLLNKKLIIDKLLFLTTVTLPMFTRLNNIVLGLFIMFVVANFIIKKHKPQGNFLKQYLPILIFFALALIASVYNSETLLLKHIEKYLSFVLIPFAFWLSQSSMSIVKVTECSFYGLLLGCLITLLICYGNVIYEMISNNEPISYFLRWRHLNHDFTNIADTHPSYLGLFICTSTYYLLFKEQYLSNTLKIIICIFFTLGMFQLASRMAMVIYLLVFIIYVIKKKPKIKKHILYFGLFLVLTSASILFFGSNYLKERILTITSITNDNRFDRLKVSYDIFKENPFLGYGFNKIEEERNIRYIESGFIIAAHHNYNAHNQLVEYLSVNGLLGALVYLIVFIFLARMSIKHKNYLFLFIFASFFVANITESMMVRIKGIEYFALVTSLFLTINRDKFYRFN